VANKGAKYKKHERSQREQPITLTLWESALFARVNEIVITFRRPAFLYRCDSA